MSPIAEPIAPIEPTLIIEDNGALDSITVEEYVARVVAHEVPYTYDEEALKAQAVAARTYLYYCLENNSHPHESRADVCTDITHCCGYITEAELTERYGKAYAKDALKASRAAALSTEGEVLTYNGAPLLAVWHASSGGYTENSGDVWLSQLPYLKAVPTPENPPVYSASFTLDEVAKILRTNGYIYNKSTALRITRTKSGRCHELTIGNIRLTGSKARSIFSLRSTDFTARISNGRLYFYTRGYGHGVGMSQNGAEVMAKGGKDYREILTHYYSGSKIQAIEKAGEFG
ncbi:MAG: stage II sporulation protein D [Clostridia bacterium]|nr:stage II sporulation protein D [Clostridia bacterium]